MPNPHPDSIPEDQMDTSPDSPPAAQDDDGRTDIEQAVEARSDAVENGEGTTGDGPLAATGDFSGNAGTGGEVKNQNGDAQ